MYHRKNVSGFPMVYLMYIEIIWVSIILSKNRLDDIPRLAWDINFQDQLFRFRIVPYNLVSSG